MEKRPLQARLTPEAHSGWDRMALDTGSTMSAIIEAMGREMRAGWRPPSKILKLARAIDRERHSRS